MKFFSFIFKKSDVSKPNTCFTDCPSNTSCVPIIQTYIKLGYQHLFSHEDESYVKDQRVMYLNPLHVSQIAQDSHIGGFNLFS